MKEVSKRNIIERNSVFRIIATLIIFLFLNSCAITIPEKVDFTKYSEINPIKVTIEEIEKDETEQFRISIKEKFHNRSSVIEGQICGHMMLGTIFTLGILPTPCDVKYYSSYQIVDTTDDQVLEIEYVDKATSLAAIWGIPMRLSEKWASRYDYDRYYDNVVEKIYREIKRERD
ncbi:MAG: hypothetical protein OEV42_08500 [Deltaproteobacteria bacterium]|nr:hypothetical protein [Deltaproteobacteria bacterium]